MTDPSQEDAASDRYVRWAGPGVVVETVTSGPDVRTSAEHDHDRVLYSAAFRRLGDVTQTSSGDATAYLHNRLTHSLRVDHMGATIAARLQRQRTDIDIAAVRAACLAHDLGHPPFGHIGEETLNRFLRCKGHADNPPPPEVRDPSLTGSKGRRQTCPDCKLPDGFEGNAQSFRIVTLLETNRAFERAGLNWTRISLAALSKYPWLLGQTGTKKTKWGAYDCDLPALKFAVPDGKKDIHAEIMDWADDIAYAVHDVEDYFRVRLIPLHNYRDARPTLSAIQQLGNAHSMVDIEEGFRRDPRTQREIFYDFVRGQNGESDLALAEKPLGDMIEIIFPKREYRGNSSDLDALDTLRSGLIPYFLGGVDLDSDGAFQVDPVVRSVNSVLKMLTWFHVIYNPDLILVQEGQKKLIGRILERIEELVVSSADELEDMLKDEEGAEPPKLRRLPVRLRRYLKLGFSAPYRGYDTKMTAYRAIADWISSLGDSEAYRVDAVLLGAKDSSHVGAAGFHA